MKVMEESIGQAAAQIANDIKADCIISLSREEVDVLEQDPLWMDITVTFFRQVKKGVYSKLQYSTKIKKAESSSIIPIKEVLMEGITKKYITQGEKIVCVTSESMGTGYKGYPEEMRKITDPSIKETVKEFAQLEGAFAINSDGTILTCGAYINVNTEHVNLPLGFGTRHRSCAALTQETDAIAVVVSQSGGIVRVFKNGKPIIKLEPDA